MLMNATKRSRLEASGWTVGDAQAFLGLSDEEQAFIDLKLALAYNLRRLRMKLGLTQTQLAHRLESSQSRVARMEAGDRSVSVDLLVRALLSLGATRRDLARIIAVPGRGRAA